MSAIHSPEYRPMHKEKLISLTRSILSQPTAPFHEERVKGEIRQQLLALRSVTVNEDKFGNLIARYTKGSARPKIAFSVHMDHPGWVQKPGAEPGEMVFLGGVKAELLDRCAIQSFGDFGMWTLPAFDYKDDKIYSRACDNLIGCAAMIAMLSDLEENAVPTSVIVVFTRAEEVGFLGAVYLAKNEILPKNITVISVETSAEVLPAKMGGGPIIRVGDRSTIFDPEVTLQLGLIAKKRQLIHQRCLMPGGTCEGTAYQVFGLRAGAICIALANYHNCSASGQIVREYISFSDFVGLIELSVAIATESVASNTFQKDFRRDLEQNFQSYESYIGEIPVQKPRKKPVPKK